jgi:hypothetical protein
MPLTDVIRADPPDCLVIFAWSFLTRSGPRTVTILQKAGRMILPLPEVSIFLPPAP